ncbi:hypothetical protein [Rhodoferax sp.]|jgi:hypothetical protein|uniref:hypothetical protein n=1 Tax=Rhodoferax sp. TaxID=50421 RepID=UPI0037830DE5
MVQHHNCRAVAATLGTVLLLAGCAQIPQAYAELPWKDMRGDRGSQVMARDFEMCERLVEARSQLKGCMASQGWELLP